MGYGIRHDSENFEKGSGGRHQIGDLNHAQTVTTSLRIQPRVASIILFRREVPVA